MRAIAIGGVALGTRPRIVAAGGEGELEALGVAVGADFIELRADLFAKPDAGAIESALVRLRSTGRPVILTVRAATEGGRALADEQRLAIYRAGIPHADAIDVEIASTGLVADLLPKARAAGVVVILSAHDFTSTPPAAALLALVDRAVALGADVTKLAAHAANLDDVRTLLSVTLAARERCVVTMAMGPAGALSRLFFPAAGSLLTYASVGEPTAPGQIPLRELSELVTRFYP
jgi:3-dehydroquinate dehydratase-1